MKRLITSSLIAMFVSTGAMAQQSSEEVDNNVDTMTQSAESAVDGASTEVNDAAADLANEADSMSGDMAAERATLRSPTGIVRDGYVAVDPIEMSAENLTGARVYGANDEDIGEVDELLLSAEGDAVEQVVIDVGGFLGMGEHEVAVTMEELHIMRSDDGTDLRVYMDATQEELEAQPEYEG
jgi:hypothetical protein